MRISQRSLSPLATSVIEGSTVVLEADGSELGLVSAHLWPGLQTEPPPKEWNALLDHPLPTIVAGDFNAKPPSAAAEL